MKTQEVENLIESWRKAAEEKPMIYNSAWAIHQLKVNAIFMLILCRMIQGDLEVLENEI